MLADPLAAISRFVPPALRPSAYAVSADAVSAWAALEHAVGSALAAWAHTSPSEDACLYQPLLASAPAALVCIRFAACRMLWQRSIGDDERLLPQASPAWPDHAIAVPDVVALMDRLRALLPLRYLPAQRM